MYLTEYDPAHLDVHHLSVEDALDLFNKLLLERAEAYGVSIGPIQIPGVVFGTREEKIRAILHQYNGLIERLAISPDQIE